MKPDVVFVLHLLSHNVNSIVASEISSKLWLKFCEDKHIEPSDGNINNNNNNTNNNNNKSFLLLLQDCMILFQFKKP